MIFYSDRTDRLGARLNSLLNAKRIANAHDAEVKFAWENASGTVQAENLFAPTFLKAARIEALPENLTRLKTKVSLYAPGASDHVFQTPKPFTNVWVDRPFGVLKTESEDRFTVLQDLSDLLMNSLIREDVRRTIEKVRVGLPDNFVAVHLRRGDLKQYLKIDTHLGENFERFCPIDVADYALSKSVVPIIFTDQVKLIPDHLQKFLVQENVDPVHLRKYPKRLVDFIHMAALSEAKEIVSGKSAFANLAAVIAGKTPTHPLSYLGAERYFDAFHNANETYFEFSNTQIEAAHREALVACRRFPTLKSFKTDVRRITKKTYPHLVKPSFLNTSIWHMRRHIK
ncbi:MAG: hypothetical protein AAF198_02225 [Pseudomonadota bacterium]